MSSNKEGDKSVHIAIGFFFFINYCVGTGFLGIPYGFVYSGYIAALPTLTFITLATWIGSNYILEVMARAQALQHKTDQELSITSASEKESDEDEIFNEFISNSVTSLPKFEITARKFEIIDLCEIFFNKYVKYIVFVAQTAFMFTGIWSDATVAGTAWATKFPFHLVSSYLTCPDKAFLHEILPRGGCLYAYYLSVAMYACIVISLSLLDLKEQAFFQLLFGLMRFTTISLIAVFCLVQIFQGIDVCSDIDSSINGTSNTYKRNINFDSVVLKFDHIGWLQSIPIFTFGYMFLTSIPSFVHPIKQKKSLHWLLVAVVFSVFISYLLIGITVSLWLRAAVQENCTLNWAAYTDKQYSMALRILSYYVVLFPSLDVISGFPLGVHVIVNGIYVIITGRDTSEKPKYRHDWLIRLSMRFIVAALPIAAAFGTSNLVRVLTISGFITITCYIIPFILQVRSIQVCKKQFANACTNTKALINRNDHRQKLTKAMLKKLVTGSCESYTTAYSFPIIGHPVTAMILVLFGVSLYAVLLSLFFVTPTKLTCESIDDNNTISSHLLTL